MLRGQASAYELGHAISRRTILWQHEPLNVSIVSHLKHSALQCFISSYLFRVLSAGSSSWTCQSGSRRGLKIIIDFLTAIKREFYSHVCESHYIVLACCVEHKYNDVPVGTSQNQRLLMAPSLFAM